MQHYGPSPSSSTLPESNFKVFKDIEKQQHIKSQEMELQHARQSIDQIHNQLSSMKDTLGTLTQELKGVLEIQDEITTQDGSTPP